MRGAGLRTPRHHDSDHRAIVVKLQAGGIKRLHGYRRKHGRFPIRLPRYIPQTEMEASFEELKAACEAAPARGKSANEWISPET